jgi:periplasmic copper chaperone A
MPVERVALPAGQSVELKPGGLHVMLINLTGPIEPGSTIEITLDFETAPDLTVTAEVRDN